MQSVCEKIKPYLLNTVPLNDAIPVMRRITSTEIGFIVTPVYHEVNKEGSQ